MEILLGFLIALAIALTGVGAGSLTTPLLMIVLGVSPAAAVGTALPFGFVVKCVSTPVYIARKQYNFRALGLLLAGGLPGVVLGSVLLGSIQKVASPYLLYGLIGTMIMSIAIIHLWRQFKHGHQPAQHDRSRYLPFLSFPIGIETGFSSAGAGALGSLLLMGMTKLTTSEVIGTDLCFGLAVSLVGGGFQIGAGNVDPQLLMKLLIGGVLGASLGSMLAGRIAQKPLRVGLLLALIVLGGQLCWRGLNKPDKPTTAVAQVHQSSKAIQHR